MAIFTGIRCVTLIKFPLELSGGSNENFAPVASLKLTMVPSIAKSAKASKRIFTFLPSCKLSN